MELANLADAAANGLADGQVTSADVDRAVRVSAHLERVGLKDPILGL